MSQRLIAIIGADPGACHSSEGVQYPISGSGSMTSEIMLRCSSMLRQHACADMIPQAMRFDSNALPSGALAFGATTPRAASGVAASHRQESLASRGTTSTEAKMAPDRLA